MQSRKAVSQAKQTLPLLVKGFPYANREEFLSAVDRFIAVSEQHARFAVAA